MQLIEDSIALFVVINEGLDFPPRPQPGPKRTRIDARRMEKQPVQGNAGEKRDEVCSLDCSKHQGGFYYRQADVVQEYK